MSYCSSAGLRPGWADICSLGSLSPTERLEFQRQRGRNRDGEAERLRKETRKENKTQDVLQHPGCKAPFSELSQQTHSPAPRPCLSPHTVSSAQGTQNNLGDLCQGPHSPEFLTCPREEGVRGLIIHSSTSDSAVKNLPEMQEMWRCGFNPWIRKIP